MTILYRNTSLTRLFKLHFALGMSVALFFPSISLTISSTRLNAAPNESEIAPERDEAKLRQQLVGSWRIVSASFDGKPSELHKTSVTIKHVTPVHVIWIGYQPEDRRIFRSAGGSWKITEGRYVETMRYGLDEKFKTSTFGKEFPFDCRFDGDKWIQSGTLANGIFLEEIWQRIKPDEDVSQWPDEN